MAENNKPAGRRAKRKALIIVILVLVVGLGVFVGIRFYFPYGKGVKTGQLNYVVYKGVIFKTYEGKLIQSGFWSSKPGGIQSNEFEFSIADPKIADTLMRAGGQVVELSYKEYFGALPWRGYSRYIVDGIVSISSPSEPAVDQYPPVDAAESV